MLYIGIMLYIVFNTFAEKRYKNQYAFPNDQ